MKTSRRIPLFFPFRELIEGDGFLAEVKGRGRVVAEERDGDGECWFNGVNPGGMTAGGDTFHAAHCAFRLAFRTVLFDFAADAAGDFGRFKAEVQRFFLETCEASERDWVEAVQSVRSGDTTFDSLAQLNADTTEWSVTVEKKVQFTADANEVVDRVDRAAKAA